MQLALGHQKVHVWKIPLNADDSSVESLNRLLSPQENDQASRFKLDRDRKPYVVAHGALRAILAGYLGVEPASLGFAANEFGKPYMVDPAATGLFFSLSHSGSVALVAVASNQEVGVDIEQVKTEFYLENKMIANGVFSELEQQSLANLAKPERAAAFFRLWTRKEAYIKFKGTGLSEDLSKLDIMHPLLQAEVVDINSIHDYAAALCTERSADVELWDFSVGS